MGGGNKYPLDTTAVMPPGQSANSEQSSRKESPIEFTVVVTGFGPFPDGKGGQFTKNASHEITRLLPGSLPRHSHLNSSSAHIHIFNPTAGDDAYIPTEYAEIRRRIHDLHEALAGKVDLFLHIGQAAGIPFVMVEKQAYKPGMSCTWWGAVEEEQYYLGKDNAGKTILDVGVDPWEGVPIGLHTSFDVDEIVESANKVLEKGSKSKSLVDDEDAKSEEGMESSGAESEGEDVTNHDVGLEKDKKHHKKHHKDKKHKKHKKHPHKDAPLDVIAHHEPGSYGCGFCFYESLANCYVQTRKRDVLFCHVPGETDEASLKKGRDAILAVIGAAVDELVKRKEAEKDVVKEEL